MINARLISLLLIAAIVCQSAYSQQTLTGNDDRTKWFTDARFGMFIHWGLYSAAEGIWKGERHRYGNNYAEWIRYRNRIPAAAYGTLAKRFVWDEIHPEEWVIMAKKAGMKYVIITAKHHDGAAIWNTNVSGYSLSKLAGVDRDPIAELAAACRKHGMRLGFYYSHWIDWEHPYGWDHNQELTGRVTDEQYNQYWQEKVIPQLRELLTNYGDIAMLWFDMWIPHEQTIVKRDQLDQVLQLVRELQPSCLVNSRLGLPPSNEGIDFETLGDNQFGGTYKAHPWETPGTIAHSWGYNALENEWKSTTQLLQSLIGNVSLNGGFTLNIGPRADGSVPYEGTSRLEAMGQWLAINGESIYGSGGLALPPRQHHWGRITHKTLDHGKERVYLHVYNWPLDNILRVSGITSTPTNAYLLLDKLKEPLSFTQQGPYLHVQVPREAPDCFVSVVVLEFAGQIQLDTNVVAEETFGGFAFRSNNAQKVPENVKREAYDGNKPEHLVITEPTTLRWKVYVADPATVNFDISYSNQAKGAASVTLQAAHATLSDKLDYTGKVVGEPNQNYYIEEFREQPLGKITFGQAGYQEVSIQIIPPDNGQLLFNRLWMQ